MVSTNDIRPGQSILLDGTLYLILEYQHVKRGKGKAFVKTKLKKAWCSNTRGSLSYRAKRVPEWQSYCSRLSRVVGAASVRFHSV